MALFKKSNAKKDYFSAATIITKGTNCLGGFIGDDSIHIDGHIEGDVKVNNVVIIGKTGSVTGNIKAQQIISSGTCKGHILCDSLELMESSKTTGEIKSNKILTKGEIKGTITCSGLFLSANALVDANVQAKNVVAGGTMIGVVICKQLKIPPTGCIKGKMFADRILNQGGHVEGFIGKYSELVQKNPQLAQYANIFNSRTEHLLLENKDYHVNVQEEIKRHTSSSTNTNEDFIDADFSIDEKTDLYAIA